MRKCEISGVIILKHSKTLFKPLLPFLGRIKDLLITAGGENVAPTLVSSIEKIKKLRLLSKNEKNIFQFIKQFNF